MTLQRRELMAIALARALPVLGTGHAYSQVRDAGSPFRLGVASGSPTADGVVLWTRLVGEDLSVPGLPAMADTAVDWEVAEDAQFQHTVQRGSAVASAALAHSVHVELQGLKPDRWYFYRFTTALASGRGRVTSPVGRTRTLPAAGAAVAQWRVAYASCQKWEDGYFTAYQHMRRDDPDLVLFLGDYLYEYPGTSSRVRRPNATPSGGWCLTLDDYRARYALYKTDPDLQAMHAACPWLMVWDDHEVQNDYAGLVEGRSGQPVPDFAARRAAAYQAYYEHMPLRASALVTALGGVVPDAELRLYQQVPIGHLLSLVTLDTRQYRDPQACTPEGKPGSATLNPASCAVWNDPQRSLLGRRQEAWLDAQFRGARQAGAVWQVVAQQTLLGQRDFRRGEGQLFWNDGWDGYAPARLRLTQSLRTHRVANAVVLGGDVHENWVGHVKADYGRPDSDTVGVEFCGTSVTSRSGNSSKAADWLAENPHFVFADTERKGYGVVDFTPQRITTRLQGVDTLTQANSQVETLARFEVEAGRSVVNRL